MLMNPEQFDPTQKTTTYHQCLATTEIPMTAILAVIFNDSQYGCHCQYQITQNITHDYTIMIHVPWIHTCIQGV